MGINGLNDYELRQRNDFVQKEGVHVCEITGCKHFESSREAGQMFFAINFTVLKSTSIAPGSARSHLIKVHSKYPDMWKRDVKGFCAAVVEAGDGDPEDESVNYDELAGKLFEGDAAEGVVLELETNRKDPSDPESFMKHQWRAPGTGAQIVEAAPSEEGSFAGL